MYYESSGNSVTSAVWAVNSEVLPPYLMVFFLQKLSKLRKTDAPKKVHRKHNSRIIALYALDFLLTAALVGVSENLQPF